MLCVHNSHLYIPALLDWWRCDTISDGLQQISRVICVESTQHCHHHATSLSFDDTAAAANDDDEIITAGMVCSFGGGV